MKRDLLFLAHRIPYPPDKGDKIRSWHLLNHLCKFWSVHLGCFVDDPDDFQHKEFLLKHCSSVALIGLSPSLARLRSLAGLLSGEALSFPYYRSGKMRAFVENVYKNYTPAAQIAYSSSMAPYVTERALKIPTLIDFCDSDAQKWTQYANDPQASLNTAMRWIYQREGKKLAKAESRLVNQVDASFAISKSEAEIFQNRSDLKNDIHVWENGVDAEYFNPTAMSIDLDFFKRQRSAPDLVFVGAMDYQANIDAIFWFANEVFEKLKQNRPDIHLAIVGSNPTTLVKSLENKGGITVTGRVEDVRPWLLNAKAVIAPLRVARGIQNKVLEAMAMAKPVVATSHAVQGIDALSGRDILLADTPRDYVEKIEFLLSHQEEGDELGNNARKFILSHFDWAAKLQQFDHVLNHLV